MVCVGLILYDIEYSTFFLVLSSSQRELRVNRDYIYIYIYEHTYRRLGGVLLTLYGYTHGVPIGFIPKVLLVAKRALLKYQNLDP